MKNQVREAFWLEITKGKSYISKRCYTQAFSHFERAHILGQSSPLLHTYSHIGMLKIAFKTKDIKEILAQLFRIPSGFLGSLIGIFPEGNTGGGNVSAFKKMNIPDDLKQILNS